MNLDSALTILLPLKDRTAFTYRWMSYANAVRLPFNVYIADGGDEDGAQQALSDHSRFPFVRYEYHRYPFDRSLGDFYAKIEDALSRIDTPLVAMAANDDFFVIDALRQAAAFLIEHPDYVTCGGGCAQFWIDRSRCESKDALYGTVDWKYSCDTVVGGADTARARLRNPLLRGHAFYNHVMRTDLLRAHFHVLRTLQLANLFLHEQLIEYLTAIAGKSQVFDTLYIARQWNSPTYGGAHLDISGDWVGCMLQPTWSEDFEKFVTVISEALAAADGLALEEARRYVIASYRMEMAPAILGALMKEPTVTAPGAFVVGIVRRLMAMSRNSKARRIARALYLRAQWMPVDVLRGTELWGRPVPQADRDITPLDLFLRRRSPQAAQ